MLGVAKAAVTTPTRRQRLPNNCVQRRERSRKSPNAPINTAVAVREIVRRMSTGVARITHFKSVRRSYRSRAKLNKKGKMMNIPKAFGVSHPPPKRANPPG
jgi:hypothetical protein